MTVVLFLIGTQVHAGQLDGSWSNQQSGLFSLELVQNGRLVCGQVTAISGDKVDASWIVGTVRARNASVQFTSAFAENGSRGAAVIQSKAGKLEWRVVQAIEQNWIFSEASVSRQAWAPSRRRLVQNWCKQHWKAIDEGRIGNINLQP
ncbi:hypothetical protein [Polaromonas sp. A23]|uniref:hypothetical protein n=1 Tax=Polaromonas sp. A23 TaxID=1944133 RepID=UPI000985E08C|nr:hypothetical protein [Polaromonas sp. A23]OOG35865.1 hypothetical protein B0B52_21355 [Polaromonas sp. A23]